MAFLNRAGTVLKQTVSLQIGSQISASNTSVYQAVRCMSSSQLFVGGLSSTVDDSSLRKMFSPHGKVISAKVIIDKEQNKPRGFGFIAFASTEEAETAIQAMDGQNVQGRKMKVSRMTSKAPSASGAGGYSGGGGGGKSIGYVGGSAGSSASKVVAAGDLGHGASKVVAAGDMGKTPVKQFKNSIPGNDAGNFKPTSTPKANFEYESDVEPDDFVKRAYARKTSQARRG